MSSYSVKIFRYNLSSYELSASRNVLRPEISPAKTNARAMDTTVRCLRPYIKEQSWSTCPEIKNLHFIRRV